MRAVSVDSFTFHADGRTGAISYSDGLHSIDIPWEMSGSERYDVLLAPLDLRYWRLPAREPIPHANQKDILVRLRQWLASRGARSDIDLPVESTLSSQRCAWRECQRMSVVGSAYCAEHFDETLLRSQQ
jgi:hypothetical protein